MVSAAMIASTSDSSTPRRANAALAPPGSSRSFEVPLASLGGEVTEPVNVELRYVYTIDEYPLPEPLPAP